MKRNRHANMMRASLWSLIVSVSLSTGSFARDSVVVDGPAAAFSFANEIGETIRGRQPGFSLELSADGSSVSLGMFCEGIGEEFIDIATSLRPMSSQEAQQCEASGVREIIQMKIGYRAFALAFNHHAQTINLTPEEIYLLLAEETGGQPNQNRKLSDVNSDLPGWDIAFYIPSRDRAAREFFEDKILLKGCVGSGEFQRMIGSGAQKRDALRRCVSTRRDGAVVEIAGGSNEVLAQIESNKTGIGIFESAFVASNRHMLRSAKINGAEPTPKTVRSGSYPFSQALFLYAKRDHLDVIPGMKEFLLATEDEKCKKDCDNGDAASCGDAILLIRANEDDCCKNEAASCSDDAISIDDFLR